MPGIGKEDEDLFALASPIQSVSNFVKNVCRRVFTAKAVWGNRRNASHFLSAVQSYVYMNRRESPSVSQLCRRINEKDLSIAPDTHGISATDVLQSLMYWIFTEFVNPLIAICFYVTEGEGKGSELFHYRKPVWSGLLRRGEAQLKDSFAAVVSCYNFHFRSRSSCVDSCFSRCLLLAWMLWQVRVSN